MENQKQSIYEKLSLIQNEMKVPKNLFNKFGNYHYRNAETILESSKVLCAKYRTTLIVFDEIVLIGNRFYVKATALLKSWDDETSISNVAYAREEETKKGMDASQLTGSTSSYARKYALNGLFSLDDTKDADSNEQAQQTKNYKVEEEKATSEQLNKLKEIYVGDNLKKLLDYYKITKLESLSKAIAENLIKKNAERLNNANK